MKFSNETVNILKNFSMINPSIAFKKGNALATMSPQKSIMARAMLDDEFPSNGAIYDLSRFLGVRWKSIGKVYKTETKYSFLRLSMSSQYVFTTKKCTALALIKNPLVTG